MTIEIVNTGRFGRVKDVQVAEHRFATQKSGYMDSISSTIAKPHSETLSHALPGKGLPQDGDILGQHTAAHVLSPDAVERYEFTMYRYGDHLYAEGPHEIFVREEIHDANLGRLRWRETQEGDYPPLPEGAEERPPDRVLKGIRTALDQGARIHGFRSGGGLRVISIEQEGESRGYGESIQADEAILHADEDFLAGGREYSDVYGKIYPHYLTGSSESSSELDTWLLKGYTFDAYRTPNGMIAVELNGWARQHAPDIVVSRVERYNTSFIWTERGFIFESSPDTFPNGEATVSTRVLETPEGRNEVDGLMYRIIKRGEGNNFDPALRNAFEAKEEEVIETDSPYDSAIQVATA